LQVVSTPATTGAIAVSIALPMGFATGLYAQLNGLRFLPWFGLGTLLPGFAFLPLHNKIESHRKVILEEQLRQQLQKQALVVNEPKVIYEKDETEISKSESSKDQNFTLSTADLSTLKPLTLLNTKRIGFNSDVHASYSQVKNTNDTTSEVLRLNRLKTYLTGTWVFEDVLLDISKKAYFEGDKFGILSNRRSITVAPTVVRFNFEKNRVKIRSDKDEYYIKPISADQIEINGQIYTRLRCSYSNTDR